MTDEDTDEFSREELEAQMAAALHDRETTSTLPIDDGSGALPDPELESQPEQQTAADEPKRHSPPA